ncbi:LicD family protein [Alkalihalobacillus pseudalcaliphilus]|uniref:LicD family protein n=1 Tax=Alkalihalobacillus pseudalcaliphilus TaxID=79884 RepID=UPI00064DFCF5|nr:LicD family protein [Alkalihalobacillus pseudalcaliphilus]KMK78304.1 hypothetical protein AB990_02425 [Alkalihalobacillus pseudalcaliphilus]
MKFINLDVEIKEVQKVQLEILLEFDRICKKHNIKYQLFAGTLLGAIRHKGFIPWDDDIDICLLREDYDKFLSVCDNELDTRYFMQTYKTDKRYFKQSGKLRKNGTVCLQEVYKEFDMHHGVSISLMPLDNVKPNTVIGTIQRKLYQFMFSFLIKLNGSRVFKRCINRKSYVERVVRIILYLLSKVIPKSVTDNLHTKVACLFNDKNTKYITHLTNGATKKRYYAYMMEREEFYNVILGEFEGMEFPIPRNYDKVLRNLYGDYMKLPPLKEQVPHHGVIDVKLNETY